MAKLPKWTERSDINWRPVSEKPTNTGRIIICNKKQRVECLITLVDEEDSSIQIGDEMEFVFGANKPWSWLKDHGFIVWAWVCWDKT